MTKEKEIELVKKSFCESFNKLWRKEFLMQNLNTLNTPEQILLFFSRYISFNSVFGGCIARLAGSAHILQSSFMGSHLNNNPKIFSECSQIASNILAAAEDEFNSKTGNNRITHCDMARFLFESVLEYFNKIDFPNNLINPKLEVLNEEVLQGYCFKDIPSDEMLISGIGFHIAAEELADQEFISIKEFLCKKFSDLVFFLKNKKNHLGLSAFYWVDIHCVVEKEHRDYGIKAMEIALENYSGVLSRLELQNKFEYGYKRFCLLQEKMINYCCNS